MQKYLQGSVQFAYMKNKALNNNLHLPDEVTMDNFNVGATVAEKNCFVTAYFREATTRKHVFVYIIKWTMNHLFVSGC